MRLLHTADLHLGKKLESFPRIEEQKAVLDEIISIADNQKVDIILVAGDLFDNFNPTSQATELLYASFKKLTNNGKRPVIAIAGNHDSADRINAPDPLARACGIFFYGYPNTEMTITQIDNGLEIINAAPGFTEFKLPNFDYPFRILTTPFANEQRLRTYLGIEDKDKALNDFLENWWSNLANKYCDSNGVNMLMAHLYVMERAGIAPEEPDGENPIHLGTASAVFTDIIPPQIQYTALGHLHKAHSVEGNVNPVWYSGSPLSYSFAEAEQTKQVNIIDAIPDKPVTVTPIYLSHGRPVIRHRSESVADALAWLAENQDAIVELTVVCENYLESKDRLLLLKAHNQLINIIPEINSSYHATQLSRKIDLSKSPEALFISYFKSKHKDAEPSDSLKDLIKEIFSTQL